MSMTANPGNRLDWATTGWKFQAPAAGSGVLQFDFGCTNAALHEIYLDNIRVTAFGGNAY